MASNIDPVSQALGRLAEAAEARVQHDIAQRKQIDDIKTMVTKLSVDVAVAINQQAAHAAADERRFLNIEHDRKNDRLAATLLTNRVNGMELSAAKKAGAIGFLATFSAMISAATAAVMQVLK